VLVALPDGVDFVAALFGTLKLGAVVVMVNPALPADDIRHLLDYSRAKAIVTHADAAPAFAAAARECPLTRAVLVVDAPEFVRAPRRDARGARHVPDAPGRPRDLAVLGRYDRGGRRRWSSRTARS
jgi:acyl-CoA synthetase (AMP-forming)/AMP-acid ligase II